MKDLDLPTLGNIIIRGVFGEPVTARLISLKIKPHPGEGYENIAPHLNVIFAACPLTTGVSMILCGTAVEQLDELAAYNVVKPSATLKRNDKVIIDRNEFMTLTQLPGQGHEMPELSEINITVDSDRSCDDKVTLSGNQDISPYQVMSSDVSNFKAEQLTDVTLQKAWSIARINKGHFFIKDDLLYHSDTVLGQPVEQLSLPQSRVYVDLLMM